VKQQHTSMAASILTTKSTYRSLSAQQLSERTVFLKTVTTAGEICLINIQLLIPVEKEIRTWCLQPLCILSPCQVTSQICTLLGFYVPQISSSLPMSRDNLMVPFSRVPCCWPVFQEVKKENVMSQSHLQLRHSLLPINPTPCPSFRVL
jgi:hypothetical protein